MLIRHAVIVSALACAGAAHASFSCAPTGDQECRLELSTVTVVFASGIYNFSGDSYAGGDAYVTGYSIGDGQFPDLTAVDTSGGTRAGFSFAPNMSASVGGGGTNGLSEGYASFSFDDIQFIAKPGYHVDGIQFTVSGSSDHYGTGNVLLSVPGSAIFTNEQFVASQYHGPTQSTFAASFDATAFYQEGPNGTALQTGGSSASFSIASVVAHVSAVPEPDAAWLAALGGLVIAAAVRRKRDSRA